MSTAALALPLVVRTVPIPDPGPLLSLLPARAPLAWVRHGNGLVGWGSAARIDLNPDPDPDPDEDADPTRGRSGDRFGRADQAWSQLVSSALVRDSVNLPGTGLVAFGSFSFAPESPAASVLVVPQVLIGRRDDHWWCTTVGVGAMPPLPTLPAPEPVAPPGELRFSDGELAPPMWSQAVARAIEAITAGTVDKVVLARDLQVQTTHPLDVRWPLQRLGERYPGCWTFSVDGLIGATPELLIRQDKGLLTSRVLAGTIQRTGDDDHDLALAASLARSSKDLEEHEYAVRSVAQALAPHCSSMNVPESPYVLHLPNVMHLATDVTGVKAGGSSVLAMAQALHPSAAVCGTPTAAAAGLIPELERLDRGRYAGPVGWVNAAGDGEFGIALRCGRVDPTDAHRIQLFAGCGIVAGSDPSAEVAESVAKLVPMRDALSC